MSRAAVETSVPTTRIGGGVTPAGRASRSRASSASIASVYGSSPVEQPGAPHGDATPLPGRGSKHGRQQVLAQGLDLGSRPVEVRLLDRHVVEQVLAFGSAVGTVEQLDIAGDVGATRWRAAARS